MMLEFHPLADIFPLLEGTELDELVADIREHGLHEPVVIYESRILDGRNRYRACMAAGVEPTFTAYQGDDPVGYVISLNLRRRHLDESQRAMVAAKLATLKLGDNQHSEGLPIGRGSDLLNVGERSVARAREVQEHGAPELVRAVERGEVSVSTAADVATLPKAEQQEIVARGKREILEAAKAIRGEEARKRYEARIARNLEISARNSPMEKGQRYPVILADPPWDYRLYNEESGSSRAAAEHYPTMKLGEICELPVSDLATEAAVLFLWTTGPCLKEAFGVLRAWGFQYKSQLVWIKDKIGLGHFVRGKHELLLVATKGDMPCPLPANRPDSVIAAPRREHSRKPEASYAIIERMYPDLPKIELFARHARPGWDAWGNEAPAQNKAIGD
jgi:N6-adenosine-specific RNA methylase IME4